MEEIELREVQDNKEAEEEKIFVKEDECLLINIFKILHNPTFVEADDNDDDF